MPDENKRGLRNWISQDEPVDEADTRIDSKSSQSSVDQDSEPALVSTDVADRFADLGEIGRGGMSTVHRARDRNLLRTVAIKILDEDVAKRRREVQRFVEEAQITGQLEHPGIVPVYEFGTDSGGSHYICMQYVRGLTLEQIIAEAGIERLAPERLADLLQIFVKVCDAVAFAHSRGVLHRDIKPSNIMVGAFGQVYVVDWGVARAGEQALVDDDSTVSVRRPDGFEVDAPGAPVGTFAYMAPEQFTGETDLDIRVDVFGLGATLFHILAGRAPYQGSCVGAIAMQIAFAQVPALHKLVTDATVPEGLCRIVKRATSKEKEERYESVVALRDDVTRFLRGSMHLPSRSFTRDKYIVREGEMGDEAYIVLRGRCGVYKKTEDGEVLIRELGPDEVFGETAVVSRKPRTASVKALDDVMVLVVNDETLSDALGLSGWMGKFVRALAERFREVDARLYPTSGGSVS